jgi:hypothetical protein
MPPTYILARDHLEQAVSILSGADLKTRQLRQIVERTIVLMEEYERRERRRAPGKVIDFSSFRRGD